MLIKLKNIVIYFLGLIFISSTIEAQHPQINEVCAANIDILFDEDNDNTDWIEIYNPGPGIVNLNGYSLSDNADSLMKWVFPPYNLEEDAFLVVFASKKSTGSQPLFWNALITEGDVWKYQIPTSEPPAEWRSPGFNDGSWSSGATGIGYGDNDDATVVDAGTISVYLRKSFTVSDIDQIEKLIFSLDYDDGFIAYLNGVEIGRMNLESTAGPLPYYTTALEYTEPLMISGAKPLEIDITNKIPLLTSGENVLAIQVHNHSSGSSDLSIIPFLSYQSASKKLEDPDPVLGLSSSSFHANFKIDKDGDSLYLTAPGGELVQHFPVEFNPVNMSLGFPNEEKGSIKVFTQPTPWFSNTSQAYELTVPGSLSFGKAPGYYKTGLYVSILSSDSGANIYYTTDGSEPDLNSFKYQGQLGIMATTTIRARILDEGRLPGEIITGTYFTKSTNGLASVFISTDPANLWDNETGIYVLGDNANSSYPYFGANFWEDWERPAHVEYYTPDGDSGFRLNAGIKVYGAYSRGHAAKSLAIYARSEYGAKNIQFKVFDDKDYDKFEALVLRNSGNEWFGQANQSGIHYRDMLMTKLVSSKNIDYQAGKPVVLYLNGEYWGIFNLREKINEHFISSLDSDLNPDRMNLLVNDNGVVQGSSQDFVQLLNFLKANSISNQRNYEYVKARMDIPNFIDYQVAQIYYANEDWPGNNIKYWKFDADYAKWRWIMYDTDFGLGLWNLNKAYNNSIDFATTTEGDGWPNPSWSTFLLRTLLQNQEFKEDFLNSMADMMNSVFLPENISEMTEFYATWIEEEMKNHVEKWGGNVSTWRNNIYSVKRFGEIRPDAMYDQLLDFFGISSLRTLSINTQGASKAKIKLNSLMLDSFDWSGIYFNDIPVTLSAIPPEGYRFVRWGGGISATDKEITYDMSSSKNITAYFEPYSKTEFEGVIINEIGYKPVLGTRDWVEIFNNSSEIKDIGGWILKDSDEGHSFKIKEGTLLKPYEYLVIVENRESFFEQNPEVQNCVGNTKFGLNSAGECVRLYDKELNEVDVVCYASEYPWPDLAEIPTKSIALVNPNTDNSLGFNWASSAEIAGTPGSSNKLNNNGNQLAGERGNLILYQNYPNPFKDETTISFKLPEAGEISISVYDINGKILDEVLNENLPEGLHEIRWKSENINPGIYILQLKDEQRTYQKRMIISK